MLSSKNLTKTYPGEFSRSSRFAGDSVLPNDVCVRFAVTKRALALVAEGVCGFPAARLVVRAERKHTHRGARNVLPPGEKLRKLDFDAPETWVRLLQGYTNVPRLMAAPNHLGCGGTPRL